MTTMRHGYAKRGKRPAIYVQFMNMKARCYIRSNKDYPRYGGIGITVCERWLSGEGSKTGFECFLEDMGPKPQGMSIDRIDSTKGYGPDNCRWATHEQQANNRRSNHTLTIDGVTKTVAQWSRVSGIGPKTILYRLKHMKMEPRDAVFTKLSWTKKGENNG